MKKKCIALLLTLCTLFSLSACGTTELQTQINQLQSDLEEKEAQIADLGEKLQKREKILYEKIEGVFSYQEAYDAGLLTRDDLMSIAYYSHYSLNEGLFPENYTPQPRTQDNLDEETKLKIKEQIAEHYINLTSENIQLYYVSEYNNRCILFGYDLIGAGPGVDGYPHCYIEGINLICTPHYVWIKK